MSGSGIVQQVRPAYQWKGQVRGSGNGSWTR